MKYMVMECHLSYAVVLDEDGRFLKAANQNYEVGQTVTDIIEMQAPQAAPQKKKANKGRYSLAAMAACLILAATSVFQMGRMTYASVYMSINPEVRVDVNRSDVVVGLEGVDADGKDLIEGYSFKKKDLELVMEELVDRAIGMGYLQEGSQIILTLDAGSEEWIVDHGDSLTTHLSEHLREKLSVTIEITGRNTQSDPVIIPAAPGQTDYGESDYGGGATPTEPPTQPPAAADPADSGYEDNDYEDGQTDYNAQDASDDGPREYNTADDADADSRTDHANQEGAGDDSQPDYGSSDDEADDAGSGYGGGSDDAGSGYGEGSDDAGSDYGEGSDDDDLGEDEDDD